MWDITAFELKKIVCRKVTLFTTIGILVCTLLFFGILPFVQAYAFVDGNEDRLSGAAAVELNRKYAFEQQGTLTEEKVTEAVATYHELYEKEVVYSNGDASSGSEASEESTIVFEGDEFGAYLYSHTDYLYLISGAYTVGYEPFSDVIQRIDLTNGARFYDAIDDRVQRALDNGMDGTRTYSDEERMFWTEKAAEVETPLEYGWAGGWAQFLSSSGFFFLVPLGIAIALAPLFTAEYQQKTDSILLSTRYGKSKLVFAKLAAAFVFATAVFALNATIALAAPLMLFGFEGGNLPVQLSGVWIPYALTYSQMSFLVVGIAYIVSLGMGAFAVALSSFMRSTLPILVVTVMVLFVPFFMPNSLNGGLNMVLDLFPMNVVDFTMLTQYMSYQLGDIVLSLPAMAMICYTVLVAAFGFLAARNFKRHQVK